MEFRITLYNANTLFPTQVQLQNKYNFCCIKLHNYGMTKIVSKINYSLYKFGAKLF